MPSVVDNLCLSDVTHYMYIYRQIADLSGESMSHAYSMNIDFPESRSV